MCNVQLICSKDYVANKNQKVCKTQIIHETCDIEIVPKNVKNIPYF